MNEKKSQQKKAFAEGMLLLYRTITDANTPCGGQTDSGITETLF